MSVAFATLRPLLLEEWPQLDASALDATGGDLDRVIQLVSDTTEKPRTLIRRQIHDLSEMANGSPTSKAFSQLEETVRRLEQQARGVADQARGVADQVRDDLVPEATAKLRENLLTSLLVALGLGFLLGLTFGLGRGR